MLKQSDIANAALTANAGEQATATNPDYIVFLSQQAREWQAALIEAKAAEQRAAKIETAAGFNHLAVTTAYPDGLSVGNLDAAQFLIEWYQPRWNADAGALEWLPMQAAGWDNVPPAVTRHLLATAPELLPDVIAELDPDDPAKALAAYLGRLRAAAH